MSVAPKGRIGAQRETEPTPLRFLDHGRGFLGCAFVTNINISKGGAKEHIRLLSLTSDQTVGAGI